MSTSNTIIDMDVKPVVVSYAVISVSETVVDEKTGDKQTRTLPKATVNEKAISKAKEEDTLVFEQNFSYDVPNTLKGLLDMSIPEEEKVNIFVQGLRAKMGRNITAKLQEVDENGDVTFQPVEGNFDARPFASEISGKRGLTDTDKALRLFNQLKSTLSESDLAMIRLQIFGA